MLVISIDVEDWPQSTWNRSLPISTRVVRNVERLLNVLEDHRVRATMFVLGKVAEKFPALIRRIDAAGHEVASHGYGHIEVFTQTREEFRADVHRSKYLLEDLLGKSVVGYRAPDFSVVESSLWALEVLAEEGFEYDSSIFPIRHARYGIETWPHSPVRAVLPSGRAIVELPMATVSVFGRRFPVAGGGYHRLLPAVAITSLVSTVLARGVPFISYCHPYEFDPSEFQELKIKIPLTTRFHQGLGRKRFRLRFERLIASNPTAVAEEVAAYPWPDFHVSTVWQGDLKGCALDS